MQFRVLGVVDAVSADGQVNLGHARVRCVLAVLLVEANHFVSVDQLMERVWGDQPPQRGRSVLYSYVSRLRAALSTDHGVLIERRSGAYALTVDEESVDLQRFRHLINDARLASEDARALALFDQALRLWRGAPFADLDTPWLASIRAALEVEREAAELDRTDVALRCGQHAELLADLSTRAAQQPFDERIAGQWMLALAGTGRQAEALAVYQRTRTVLLDQLGLEPGPELRDLHERILAGNAHHVTPAPTTPLVARSEVVTPHQLPAAVRHFIGRQTELDELAGLLESPDAVGGTVVITAIDGMAGIGKTALAVHAAHRVADRFPDGVLFTDLHGFTPEADPTAPEQVLDQLLRGLGVPGPRIPPDLEARAGLYRSVLADRRVLIVLDNAADETQLQPLLPATTGCRVIVTSRRHLAGLDDATRLTLPVLDPADAAGLFCGLAGDRATSADQPTIDRIVALCGRLPLAIRIAAARLRLDPTGGPDTLCAELADALGAGQGLEWLTDGHRAVGAALAMSFRHLTVDQQHVFRLAGVHPGPDVEPYSMAALADTTVQDARRLLQDMYAASLIDQPTHHRYTLHDLVAAYATTLAANLPEPDRHAALNRLYDHYAATTSHAMNLTRPWETNQRPHPPTTATARALADREQAQAWLDAETDNLLAAAHHAPTQQRADHTLRQSATLRHYLHARGDYSRAALLHEQALTSARRTENHMAEPDALNGLGTVRRLQGRYGLAADCFEQALAGAHQIGDHTAEQDALNGLGARHYVQGRYGPAADCHGQALTNARQTDNHTAEQNALDGLGLVHCAQGQLGPAADYFQQALTNARQTGDHATEQVALRGVGAVHLMLGQYESAAEYFQQALTSARQTDNPHVEQDALSGLGHVHYVQGRYEPAADYFQQALTSARRTGHHAAEQDALSGLGQVHYVQGRYGPAADCFERALANARHSGNRNEQFEAHQGIGRVHHATGNHHDALLHHQTSLQLADDLDQPTDQARAHDGLAHIHLAQDDPGQARHHWQAALQLLTKMGTDHTDEPGVTSATVRGHLLDLDNPATTE